MAQNWGIDTQVRCSHCAAVSSSKFEQAVAPFGHHDLEVINECKMKTNLGLVDPVVLLLQSNPPLH